MVQPIVTNIKISPTATARALNPMVKPPPLSSALKNKCRARTDSTLPFGIDFTRSGFSKVLQPQSYLILLSGLNETATDENHILRIMVSWWETGAEHFIGRVLLETSFLRT
jgi:hypothetical protein